MRYLIVSDIHGNWEALQAVLEDASGRFDQIVCCGDLVGYGPDPNRVIEWARVHLSAVIRGNHDRACCGMEDLEWFNPIARAATHWTIAALSGDNIAWLRELPQGPKAVNGFALAHGSPLDEDEYLMSLSDAANVFHYLESPLTFFGHTHVQGGFSWVGGRQRPIEKAQHWETATQLQVDPEGAYLINPGSVGQPRDGDSRAAYALFDNETKVVLLPRVPYDTLLVKRKIEAAGLPPALGLRLTVGR